jgi:hypothetical protein
MTLLSSLVILSVICSGVANGFERVVEAEAVVVLSTITYSVIGEELNSSIMTDMIRFSTDIIEVLSLRLQFVIEGFSPVMSKDDL